MQKYTLEDVKCWYSTLEKAISKEEHGISAGVCSGTMERMEWLIAECSRLRSADQRQRDLILELEKQVGDQRAELSWALRAKEDLAERNGMLDLKISKLHKLLHSKNDDHKKCLAHVLGDK